MHYVSKSLYQDYFFRHQPSGLGALRINFILSQFVVGMISTFGVLFIYQLGTGFFQGISFVFLFYSIQRSMVALVIPIVGALIARIGYRWMMTAGLGALVVKLIFFSFTTQTFLLPLIPALIAGGIFIPSYFLAFHALFLDESDGSKVGEQIGALEMLGRLITILSPFVAGVVTQWYGFHFLFGISGVILFFSLIPLFWMKKHQKHTNTYSFSKVEDFANKETKTSLSVFFFGITVAINIFFWPIFLFQVLGSYGLFGLAGSLVMIMNSVAVYVTGKMYDKHGHKKFYEASAFVVILTWIARFVSFTPLTVIVADIAHRIASPPFWMKIRRYELVRGEIYDSLVFAAAHEFLYTFGMLGGLVVGFCLLVLSSGNWIFMVIPAFVGTLAPVLLLKDE